ncbi:MAG: MBL fold metallo-hydrolase [Rhodospirillales bacterium]|nr:MBL fold metallo-hydrolase [Rhodospirillales bacterium]
MGVRKLGLSIIALIGALIMTLGAAAAQQISPKQVKFPCGAGIAQMNGAGPFARLMPASFSLAEVPIGNLSIQFIGHASFLVSSPQGVKVITDYNDNYRADVLPDIATMNIQRGNHSTYEIDPAIKFVLRGWDTGSGLQRHDVRVKDVRVYNLPTNILNSGAGLSNFSSMFIIQSAGLCVAHMGHLAHMLNKEQFHRIGRIDVLLVPVDGRVTQSMDELVHNIRGINPRIVVPMHFNVFETLDEFLSQAAGLFPIKKIEKDSLLVNRSTLPQNTEIWLMRPRL